MDEQREKYLQGKMTEAEQKAFEKGLSAQEKEELAVELGIRSGLESRFRQELRAKVAGFETRRKTAKRINPAYIGIAASLFLVASLVLYFTRDQTPLFDQYYEIYPNYEVTTVRGVEDSTSRMAAYAAYDLGNYETAISEFSTLDKLTEPDLFFRGISNIQVGNLDKALRDFEEVRAKEDGNYNDASIWYSALIHLKQNNNKEAIKLLESLSEGDSEFATSSTELLSKL